MTGSPYAFLSVERLVIIRDAFRDDQFGANYELVNHVHRWFVRVQDSANSLLTEQKEVEVEELDWPRGSIHDLRRTYSTRIARIVPIHVLKEYLGHAKIRTTQVYYLAAEAVDAQTTRASLEQLISES